MSDDIVTRLRELNNSTEHNPKDWICIWEAADEIERLRAELGRWQQIAKTLGDGYSLTAEQRPALQAVYERFYMNSPTVMDAI